MSDYRVHSSERIYSGAVVGVRVDQVQMPGGGGDIAAREVVEHDRAVAVVAVDNLQRVTLIEQYRHPFGRRLWELPAGLMDVGGESPLHTAQRELSEETGLTAGRWGVLVDLAVSPGFTTEAVRVFLARDLTDIGRQGEIAHEEADLRRVQVPLAQAVAAVLDGAVVNASAVAGILATERVLAVPGRSEVVPTRRSAVVPTGRSEVVPTGRSEVVPTRRSEVVPPAPTGLRPGDDPWTSGPTVVAEQPDTGRDPRW